MLQKIVARLSLRLPKPDAPVRNAQSLASEKKQATIQKEATTENKPKSNVKQKPNKSAAEKNPSVESMHKRVWPKQYRDTLFGIHPVEMCLNERKRKMHKIFCSKIKEDEVVNENLARILRKAQAQNIPVRHVHPFQMNVMTNRAVHQGIALQASPLNPISWSNAMEAFGRSDDSGQLCIYLDRITDPMNMGSILRTAVFLGINGIFVPTSNSCRISPVVAKASAGASECAPLYSVEDPPKFLTFLQRLGWDIVGSDEGCVPYTDCKVTPRNRLIVLGNESHGVNEDLVSFLTTTVSIPGFNQQISSLNVSVATGILLSHFAKTKQQFSGSK
ncbi:rRNA methyltransferase 1 [Tropilaelaps mercedesae]|uniref:rRNA methyltransferase 1, mitochondrial n=1 Tax=Tropilaelaps mercedesae TaxID=418985 RepID=A0A1V9XZZ3_9ACAR|nr:rRNA methyltransferase 1 [Tropilaelaps mercedesae]